MRLRPFRSICAGLLCMLLMLGRITGASFSAADRASRPAETEQRLTPEGQTELRAFIEQGRLPDLNWPDFSHYRTEVAEFYDAFNGTLPWIRSNQPTPQARAIIKLLENAEIKGLRPDDYDAARWEGRLTDFAKPAAPPGSDLIRFDLALTVSTMRYVSDLHFGRVNPNLFHFKFDIGPGKLDLSQFIQQQIVNAADVKAVMDTVDPPFPTYRRTLAALSTYLDLARKDDGQPLPIPRKTVEPGDPYPGVPRLTRLLLLLGDLPEKETVPASETTYSGALVEAVKHFQGRHGLLPDGRLGVRTLRALNIPLSQRVTQLELTLERWRWMPHQFRVPPIVVNIPEFRLRAVDEKYRWALSMGVVVGRAYRHKTPVFASTIRSVTFRPYWNVPVEIQKKELVPLFEKDPGYLAQHSYEVVDNRGNVITDSTVSVEVMEQLRSGRLSVRQKPGPDNALGLVRFDFPNPYDVYMHGTPATELFLRPRRDFSHGCIRVEDPVALTEWVLRSNPDWGPDEIRAAMDGSETIRVEVAQPIPVLIVYGTVVVMENGDVHFFDDIYGYDAELERALATHHPG
jgi:L,D-transpeptidase YcbB